MSLPFRGPERHDGPPLKQEPDLSPLFSLDARSSLRASAEEGPPRRRSPVPRAGGGGRSSSGRSAEVISPDPMADREASPIPLEIRARLAELELELSEGRNESEPRGKKRRLPSFHFSRFLIFLY